jgi:hypothetical protein
VHSISEPIYWNITISEAEGKWAVFGGDQAIYWADNREAVDAFLYGMGLAYSVIPSEIIKRYMKDLGLEYG